MKRSRLPLRGPGSVSRRGEPRCPLRRTKSQQIHAGHSSSFHVRPLGPRVNGRFRPHGTAADPPPVRGKRGQKIRLGSRAADDLPEPLEPGGDVAFGAVGGGFVVIAAHEIVRRVLLGGDGVRRVVGIFVTLAMTQLF